MRPVSFEARYPAPDQARPPIQHGPTGQPEHRFRPARCPPGQPTREYEIPTGKGKEASEAGRVRSDARQAFDEMSLPLLHASLPCLGFNPSHSRITRSHTHFSSRSSLPHFSLQSPAPSSSSLARPRFHRPTIRAVSAARSELMADGASTGSSSGPTMRLLFVEMGVGYDQHGSVLSTFVGLIRLCVGGLTRLHHRKYRIPFRLVTDACVIEQARCYRGSDEGLPGRYIVEFDPRFPQR